MVLRPVEGVGLVRRVDVLARPATLALRSVREVLTTLRDVAVRQAEVAATGGTASAAEPHGPT